MRIETALRAAADMPRRRRLAPAGAGAAAWRPRPRPNRSGNARRIAACSRCSSSRRDFAP